MKGRSFRDAFTVNHFFHEDGQSLRDTENPIPALLRGGQCRVGIRLIREGILPRILRERRQGDGRLEFLCVAGQVGWRTGRMS